MNFEITAKRVKNRNNPKEQYSILVELKGDWLDLRRTGLQAFYKGTLHGTDAEKSLESFLLGLEQKCNLESKVVVADKNTRILACKADKNNYLNQHLNELGARYLIAPRNEWVSWAELHDFYTLNEETGYRPGTPVERLRQAAFDTRRTGKAFFNLGELKGWQPDVEFLFENISEEESDRLENQLQYFHFEVHNYESNDGIIKPKLTIKEADKVARLFEQMADIVEPFWNRVEEEYDRGNEK
ncbi:hypothetical protein KY338_02050 [Candidatus Woesearchaeota archaeon]|nr:hypothetical protein [Candidatus Woesearchaeota archaeon]MBW3005940.1 hypothetical protein [Candidatus Woesearchaeota archaeon]